MTRLNDLFQTHTHKYSKRFNCVRLRKYLESSKSVHKSFFIAKFTALMPHAHILCVCICGKKIYIYSIFSAVHAQIHCQVRHFHLDLHKSPSDSSHNRIHFHFRLPFYSFFPLCSVYQFANSIPSVCVMLVDLSWVSAAVCVCLSMFNTICLCRFWQLSVLNDFK